MASRKLNTEGIDESLLLASIGKSRQMGDTLAREEAGNAESAIKPSVADPSENAARTVETKTKPEPVRKKRTDYGSTQTGRAEKPPVRVHQQGSAQHRFQDSEHHRRQGNHRRRIHRYGADAALRGKQG